MKSAEYCATCRFYCQDGDPEDLLYYDTQTGECRRTPPHTHFVWHRVRPLQWCGEWQAKGGAAPAWRKISTHPKTGTPVLLYRRGDFCKGCGVVVAYWNTAFNKWHDGGDRLFEFDDATDWMELPQAPEL
jgi:hypothetical protein